MTLRPARHKILGCNAAQLAHAAERAQPGSVFYLDAVARAR